jgi:hypothetical protein
MDLSFWAADEADQRQPSGSREESGEFQQAAGLFSGDRRFQLLLHEARRMASDFEEHTSIDVPTLQTLSGGEGYFALAMERRLYCGLWPFPRRPR